ncbi:hypothetical protein GA0116948_1295 [Chitinophaga costaii]|uniref:Uncharacterized protein n=1 Tax=Chitinophaga costaii TaxID=1335309 RepID=A0A1C4G8R6_9BACT|nr:hypothetical protein [Chitinophaga costaii]SCC64303.1 hypothetical protein GA0116948_1295 [Chitinophaga costaii]
MNATKITMKEAEELLSSNKHKAIVPKVLKYLKAEKAFILKKDERTIIFYNDRDVKIIPFAELFNYIIEMDRVFLSDPKPEEVILNVVSNIEKFKKLFRVPDEKFTYSIDVLKHVDKMYSKLESEGVNEAEMFYPLVSYCGELLIRLTKGNWQVGKNNSGKPVPIIKGEDGKVYDPYFSISEILVNGHKPYSFQVAIKSQLEENKLKLANPAKNIPLEKIILNDGKTLSEAINKKSQ